MAALILQHREPSDIRYYDMFKEERSQLRGLKNENFSEARISVELLGAGQVGQVFRVNTERIKQTNANGLYRWVAELWPLRSSLVIETDTIGMMIKIHNMDEVKERWYRAKKGLLKAHREEVLHRRMIDGIEELLADDEQFAQSLRYTTPYADLLPGIYNKSLTSEEKVTGYRELPFHIGTAKIPIVTAEYLGANSNNTQEVQADGAVDTENFDQESVTALVKTFRNRLRAPTHVQIKYTERYAIDRWNWPVQTMNCSLVSIPGFLYREERTIFKNITLWKKSMYQKAYS